MVCGGNKQKIKKRHKCLLKVVKNSLKYNVFHFNIKLFKFLWCFLFLFSDGDVTVTTNEYTLNFKD